MRSPSPRNRLTRWARLKLALSLTAIASVIWVLVFPVCSCGGNRENARHQDAQTVARAVAKALGYFHADCGHYPKLGTPRTPNEKFVMFGPPEAGCAQSNAELFDVLRGIARGGNTAHALNPRQVKYYEGKKARDPQNPRDGFTDGPDFATGGMGRLMDPWGSEYCVVIETDGDGQLDLGPIYPDLAGKPIPFGVAVFSLGKNGALGGKGYEGRYQKAESKDLPDDIASW